MRYGDVGVVSNEEFGLRGLLEWTQRTSGFRESTGRPLLDTGYFANVVGLAGKQGLAVTTDGVGSKILLCEMLGKYDTIGIDCVAMNVNDIICVGAEPIAMLDYIAIEKASKEVLTEIGKGLHEGARQASVAIVGGEISQIGEMIKGLEPGRGVDLVGMCVGLVDVDAINAGQDVRPGDVIVGLRSNGVHCNGLTLARGALFERGEFQPESHVPELGRPVGEELLEPTLIYSAFVMQLLRQEVPVHALVNVTSDGFLNLARVQTEAPVGFEIDALPDPQPIFRLIQEVGEIEPEEMFRVFNMGIGFCVVVPDDGSVQRVHEVATETGFESVTIGRVTESAVREVALPQYGLVREGDGFRAV